MVSGNNDVCYVMKLSRSKSFTKLKCDTFILKIAVTNLYSHMVKGIFCVINNLQVLQIHMLSELLSCQIEHSTILSLVVSHKLACHINNTIILSGHPCGCI